MLYVKFADVFKEYANNPDLSVKEKEIVSNVMEEITTILWEDNKKFDVFRFNNYVNGCSSCKETFEK